MDELDTSLVGIDVEIPINGFTVALLEPGISLGEMRAFKLPVSRYAKLGLELTKPRAALKGLGCTLCST